MLDELGGPVAPGTTPTRYLLTGSAGFIGFHLARRLLSEGHTVTGIDGMTSYYDVELKQRRHALLHQQPGFRRHEFMLEDQAALDAAVRELRTAIRQHWEAAARLAERDSNSIASVIEHNAALMAAVTDALAGLARHGGFLVLVE